MFQIRQQQLGVLPVAVGLIAAGSALEAAWAWYDPNAFGTPFWEADEEDKVARLNNAWHMLDRTARSVGLPINNPAMVQLYADMEQWWTWKQQYNDAVVQRWVPFASDREWDVELNIWLRKWQENNDALARAAGEAYRKKLEQKVDPRFLEPTKTPTEKVTDVIQQTTKTVADAPKHALFWPAMGALGLGIALVWIGAKAGSPRRVTR